MFSGSSRFFLWGLLAGLVVRPSAHFPGLKLVSVWVVVTGETAVAVATGAVAVDGRGSGSGWGIVPVVMVATGAAGKGMSGTLSTAAMTGIS